MKSYNLFEKEIYNLFFKNNIFEVRIIGLKGYKEYWDGYSNGVLSGYFDNITDFKEKLEPILINQKETKCNIYFTLQKVNEQCIGRAYNILKSQKNTTSDKDIISYNWIPIDIVPIRPSGVSSYEYQLKKSIEKRNNIMDYLLCQNENLDIITANSGNGTHILIKKDIVNNEQNTFYVKNFIQNIHKMFSDEKSNIDLTVYNPSRIWKLYGSYSIKGDEVNKKGKELIYRQSYIDGIYKNGVNII